MGYRQTGKTKVINERLTLTFYEKKEADITRMWSCILDQKDLL